MSSVSTATRTASRFLTLLMLATLLVFPGRLSAADALRNAAYFFEQAIAGKPSFHDVEERIRIARGIDPDHMTEFSAIHEAVASSGDPDSGEDEFQEEAYGQLRAEIRMTYAELASTRGEADEVRRSLGLYRQVVEMSNTLYANGKIDQAQALQAQLQRERLSEDLLVLERRERIFSVRLNILTGSSPEQVIAPLEPLREYKPSFDSRELAEGYKSRRFFVVFQQVISPSFQVGIGEGLHGIDSLEVESAAFVATTQVTLESLSTQARGYKTALLPRAEQSYVARLEAYKNGRLDFAALLESLRELAEMHREYQSLLGEMYAQKSHAEFLTGVDLD